MVIKGGARAEANKLAAHLLRVDMNERVDVRELLGVCSPDLTAALLEMEAIASAARSRRPFYHASINTAPNELMTDAQKARAIDRLEQELGLTGQPRIVVEHVKAGREHLHVAWSRIDGETLCAIPDSHNYRRHEIVARELEREFEHARVQGAHHEREGVERPARRPSHAETRQAERSGQTPAEAKEQLRELWRSADNGQAFAAALDNAGWTLAQGDRRGYVALDPAGEVHAVNKAVTGLTAAQVRERLADLDLEQLPAVDQAREQLRNRQRQPEPAPAPEADREADEKACLEAMASKFDSRVHSDGALGLGANPDHGREKTSAEHMACEELQAENSPQQPKARPVFDGPDDLEIGRSAGDCLKSPEEMRREWAELMRGGVSVERAAENATAWEKAAEDLAQQKRPREPAPKPDHTAAQKPDPLAERTAWAERLRGFAAVPAQEARPEAKPFRESKRTPKRDKPTQPPEQERGGVIQKLRDFVRGWFQKAPQQAPTRDRDDRQHEVAGDRPTEHVRRPPPADPKPVRPQQPEPETARPAERFTKRDFADELLAEARARLASQTPEQRAEHERHAEQSRGRGDGSRERTRKRHSLLWELIQPFHDHRRRDHQGSFKP